MTGFMEFAEMAERRRARRRKAERLERTAARMRHKNLHTGSGCRSIAAAIAKRTKTEKLVL